MEKRTDHCFTVTSGHTALYHRAVVLLYVVAEYFQGVGQQPIFYGPGPGTNYHMADALRCFNIVVNRR